MHTNIVIPCVLYRFYIIPIRCYIAKSVKREIKEELNLDVEIIDSFMLDGEKLQRSYKKYFVGIIRINKNIKIELEKTGKGKILKYEWFKINKMDNNSKIIMDSDIYPFVEKGINYLNNEIMIENLRDK